MEHLHDQDRPSQATSRPTRTSPEKSVTRKEPRASKSPIEAGEESDSSLAATSQPDLQIGSEVADQQNSRSGGKRFDELGDEQLEIFAQNCWLVSLIEKGVPIREALCRLGIKRSERSVRDLMRRYKEQGRSGLLDQRWFRRTEPSVLTAQVKKLTLSIYFEFSAAGPRAIWTQLCKTCRELGLGEPSESAVSKYLSSLPEAMKMFRRGEVGVRLWEHTAAPFVRYENTRFANERWQGDHSPLQLWVRAKLYGVWRPFRAYISVVLDAHSRAIPGFVVSIKYPDGWTIALLFYRAITSKWRKTWLNRGIPFIFQCDRGRDFLSHAVAATLGKLGTALDPDPPHYPNRKGKVERWFQTLDTGCLRVLPGHMDAIGTTEGAAAKRVHEFLTVPQLTAEIERWIDEDYHQRVHSETGRKPAELWEETVRLRMPDSTDDLNLLLLKQDVERGVKNTGVHVSIDGVRRIYWSPVLMYHFQQRVSIAYNPEDLDSVLVYCASTGKFICEAFDMRSDDPRYTVADVRRERSLFRRGMKERIQEYMDEVYREDRRMARVDEWEEARRQALAAPEEEAQQDNASDEDKDVMALLEKFRRRDRGEA